MADIRVNVPAALKNEAVALYKDMGMTLSEAVRIFLAQSVNSGGMPFTPCASKPNAATLAAFKEANSPNHLECYESVDEIFDSLDLDD